MESPVFTQCEIIRIDLPLLPAQAMINNAALRDLRLQEFPRTIGTVIIENIKLSDADSDVITDPFVEIRSFVFHNGSNGERTVRG